MDNEYVITPSGTFVGVDELYHHGIKGMKWGVRRYQNPDGSLTANGKKRYLNSDGTLNKKGEKYYAKESERLKNEKKALTSQKRAAGKLGKLDEMRKKNADLKDELNGKKKNDDENKPKKKSPSDMDDNELQARVNRLRNEDAYRDLSKKLGYDGPKTELDSKIASMEKQKRYLELQRDIKNLTPKNQTRAQKIVENLWNKVVEPAAVEVGKNYLKKSLGEAVAKKTKDTLKKEAESIDKTVRDSDERVKRKKAKKESKQRARQSSEEVFKGTIEDARESSSAGKAYTSDYMNTPIRSLPAPNIAGYLPEPKERDR